MTDYKIRMAGPEDAVRMAELDRLCFGGPWSLESFEHELNENENAFYIVACADDVVVGYAGLWLIVGEGHITNVAVHPDFRRRQLGEKMLEVLFKVTGQVGVHDWTLEVRASNQPAQSLYRKFGFAEAGVRKGYYQDNKEDALIMWRHL